MRTVHSFIIVETDSYQAVRPMASWALDENFRQTELGHFVTLAFVKSAIPARR
jgi:hypothetical protein